MVLVLDLGWIVIFGSKLFVYCVKFILKLLWGIGKIINYNKIGKGLKKNFKKKVGIGRNSYFLGG